MLDLFDQGKEKLHKKIPPRSLSYLLMFCNLDVLSGAITRLSVATSLNNKNCATTGKVIVPSYNKCMPSRMTRGPAPTCLGMTVSVPCIGIVYVFLTERPVTNKHKALCQQTLMG